MKKTLNNKGFTVVEFLVYMGIFSILIVILMQLLSSILDVHLESQSTSSVTEDGNYILSRIAYDLHQGSTVLTPPIGASSSTMQVTGSGSNYTYSLSEGNLMLADNTAGFTDQINSANTTVSGITFKTLGNTGVTNPKPSVQIILNIQSKTIRKGGVLQSKTFQTTIGVR